jgi:hypothetical protein
MSENYFQTIYKYYMGCVHSMNKKFHARNKLGDEFTLVSTTQAIHLHLNKIEVIEVQGHMILIQDNPHYFIIDTLGRTAWLIRSSQLSLEVTSLFCCTPFITHPTPLSHLLKSNLGLPFDLSTRPKNR